MKKSKIVVEIVVEIVVAVLLVLVVWLITVMNNQRISPNEPFDYMRNLKTYGYSNYEDLSTGEKKMVYSIPEDVSKTLTTEALLETILNNEYLIDLFAYDNFVKAVQSREDQFRIMEFLSREDSMVVLEKYLAEYKVYDVELDGLNEIDDTDGVLKYRLLDFIKNNKNEIMNGGF